MKYLTPIANKIKSIFHHPGVFAGFFLATGIFIGVGARYVKIQSPIIPQAAVAPTKAVPTVTPTLTPTPTVMVASPSAAIKVSPTVTKMVTPTEVEMSIAPTQ